MIDLEGKAAFVTGASRGIGAAILGDLAARGFTVAGLSRSGEAAVGYGLKCDVRDERSVTAAVEAVAAKGPIIGVVNGAGAHSATPSVALSVADFDDTIRLNTTSVLLVCQKSYPHLVRAGGGLIVNIGSFFDKLAVPKNLAYCASKAAVGAITRCLAAEWAREGIRVLNVAPGYIETDLNREFLGNERTRKWLADRVPAGRAGEPGEVARLVGALFMENISFLTGETLYLDGGQGIKH